MTIFQAVVYAVVTAATYALVAIGLSLILRTARFFNFAHGATFTVGAYLAFFLHTQLILPAALAIVVAAVGGGLLGALVELGVFRPLRLRSAPPLVSFVCSLGLYVVLQNVVSIVWGDQVRTSRLSMLHGPRDVFGVHVTGVQIVTVGAAGLLSALTYVVLHGTSIGKAIRAVANDSELSRAMGVRSDIVVLFAFVFGSAYASVAGALMGLDLSVLPPMGMGPLMAGMVAVVVGGGKSLSGVLLASLGLGFGQALAVWHFGSRWQDSVAFVILLGALLLRPGRLAGELKAPSSGAE